MECESSLQSAVGPVTLDALGTPFLGNPDDLAVDDGDEGSAFSLWEGELEWPGRDE